MVARTCLEVVVLAAVVVLILVDDLDVDDLPGILVEALLEALVEVVMEDVVAADVLLPVVVFALAPLLLHTAQLHSPPSLSASA